MVNIILWNLLRRLSGENTTEWDMVLEQAKFSYNDLVNKSNGKTASHIVYTRSKKRVVDLTKLSNLGERKSIDASDFANSIQKMHE